MSTPRRELTFAYFDFTICSFASVHLLLHIIHTRVVEIYSNCSTYHKPQISRIYTYMCSSVSGLLCAPLQLFIKCAFEHNRNTNRTCVCVQCACACNAYCNALLSKVCSFATFNTIKTSCYRCYSNIIDSVFPVCTFPLLYSCVQP